MNNENKDKNFAREYSIDPRKIGNIPERMRNRRAWVCWRYEEKDGKHVKIPIAPWATGNDKAVSVTDPVYTTTFNMALEYAVRNGWGLGFVFFSGDGLTGIDIDDLDIFPEAYEIIREANSYTERSPSGRGCHVIVGGRVRKAIKHKFIEVYSEDRFFTVTGDHIEGTPLVINEAQDLLDSLEAKYGEHKFKSATVDVDWETHVNSKGYTLREIREKDRVLDAYLNGDLAGKPSPSEADMGTLKRLLFWGYEPLEAVAILKKYRWRDKLLRDDYIEGMLQKILPVKEMVKPKNIKAAKGGEAAVLEVEPKRQTKETKASGVLPNGCFEAIYHEGKPRFLVLRDGRFTIAETVECNGKTYEPKGIRDYPYEPYDLYEGEVDAGSLFREVKGFIQKLVDVEEEYQNILAACVLLSYQQEQLQSVPYLFIYGDNESGKTTVLKLLSKLCYRALFGVTIPSADLYSYLEDEETIGCILEDEIQGVEKDVDKIKIYKSGYARGVKVPRVIMTENSRYIKYFNTFCFKACAGEQIPRLKGFAERFIFIQMVEGSPEVEWVDLTNEDFEKMRVLRNKLLKWRMLTRSMNLPEIPLKIKGRIKEIWKPILQVTYGLPVYESLERFVEAQEKERLSGRQNTLEGKIVKIVTEILNNKTDGSCEISFSQIWSRLQDELNGKIDPLRDHIMHTDEFDDITKNKIGYRLREVLGGVSLVKKEKDLEGNLISVKTYRFNLDKVKRVAKKYGYVFSTKLPSLSTPKGVNNLEGENKKEEKSLFSENKLKKDEEKIGENTDTLGEVSKLSNLVERSSGLTDDLRLVGVDGSPSKTEDLEGEGLITPRVCGECRFWRAAKCALRPDWVAVMPAHQACERYKPKEDGS